MSSSNDINLDIQDMEGLLAKATRPKVRAILSDYLDSLRAEKRARGDQSSTPAAKASVPVAPISKSNGDAALAPAKPSPAPPKQPAAPPPPPPRMPTPAPSSDPGVRYTPISSFGWDQDGYGKEPNYVYVYITSGVDGVGDIKERVKCDFTKNSFDLKIMDLNGKNFRLLKDHFDKELDPEQSKVIVKKNRITVKMLKIKGQYGYDQWIDLNPKKKDADGKEKNPGDSLMDMMKQMYDDGDDQMKKTLGEAMMKSQQQKMTGEWDDYKNLDEKM